VAGSVRADDIRACFSVVGSGNSRRFSKRDVDPVVGKPLPNCPLPDA